MGNTTENVNIKFNLSGMPELNSVSSIFGDIKSKIGLIGGAIGIAGGAIVGGATLASGAIVKLATSTAEAGDRIDKLSQRLGLSRQGFQEWDFILSQSGITIDSMQMGMKTLSQRMSEAITQTGRGAEYFKELGINITKSMSQEEAFNKTVRALQNMEDGIKKANIAQKLFGRNGQELLPLLNSEAGNVDKLRKKFKDLGMGIKDDAIDSSVKFTDQMDQAKRAMGGVVAEIGGQILPAFTKLLDKTIEVLPVVKKKFMEVYTTVRDKLKPIFEALAGYIKEDLFNALMYIAGDDAALDKCTNMSHATKEEVKKLRDEFVEVAGELTKFGKDLDDFNAKEFIAQVDSMVRSILELINFVKDAIDVINTLQKYNPGAWIAKQIVDISAQNQKAYRSLEAHSKLASWGTGAIPQMADGGVSEGGLTLVGENGPELRYLNRGDRIFNNTETNNILSGAMSREMDVNVFGSIMVNTPNGSSFTMSKNQIERIVADAIINNFTKYR